MGTTIELQKVIDFLGVLRDWDENAPYQQAQALLAVAMFPGTTMSDLSDRLDLAQSSMSRNIAALGKVHRLRKEGLDFVEARVFETLVSTYSTTEATDADHR